MKVFIASALCLSAAMALKVPFLPSNVMSKARCDMGHMHKCAAKLVGVFEWIISK